MSESAAPESVPRASEETSTNGFALLKSLASKRGGLMAAHLQIADRCNHACVHCYQVQGQKGELDFDGVCAVLDELAQAGASLLNVSGGEATLRDDFLEIIAAARSRGFAVRLFTNGYTMTDDLAAALARIGLLEVDVSVYSDRPEEHDAVTRVPGSHARTMAGIRALRNHGVRVRMKCPVLSIAPGAKARLGTVAAAFGCEISFDATITPGEDGSLDTLSVSASERQLIEDGAVTAWEPSHDDRAATLSRNSCGVCNGTFTVLSNGEVRPCTDTLVPLGNLAVQSAESILAQPEVTFFRKLNWSQVHGCRDCDLVSACIRCHAAAAHEAGDYLGPYRTACSRARARYAAGVGELTVLEPAEGCDAARDRMIGPYRIEGRAVIRPIPDRLDDADQDRAERFPWIRPTEPYVREMLRGPTAPIVPLRRSRGGPPISQT